MPSVLIDLMTLHAFSRHMDPHIKDLKRRQDHNWKRHLVDSFETSLKDPPVSRNVEKYTVPDTDPIEALRGQLGLRTVGASDVFVVGVYRSRTMLELPTYTEQERCVEGRKGKKRGGKFTLFSDHNGSPELSA